MSVSVPGRPDVYLERADIEWTEGDQWTKPHWTVWERWHGVDRPRGAGTACSTKALAGRLKAAIEAGAAIGTPELKTDVNGKSYVWAPSRVLARMLNADLRRLGF